MLLPQEKRVREGEASKCCRILAGWQTITPRVSEGSCVRAPDSGTRPSPSGTESEAMIQDSPTAEN